MKSSSFWMKTFFVSISLAISYFCFIFAE